MFKNTYKTTALVMIVGLLLSGCSGLTLELNHNNAVSKAPAEAATAVSQAAAQAHGIEGAPVKEYARKHKHVFRPLSRPHGAEQGWKHREAPPYARFSQHNRPWCAAVKTTAVRGPARRLTKPDALPKLGV